MSYVVSFELHMSFFTLLLSDSALKVSRDTHKEANFKLGQWFVRYELFYVICITDQFFTHLIAHSRFACEQFGSNQSILSYFCLRIFVLYPYNFVKGESIDTKTSLN
jgi:hypothetical protein